MSSPKAGTRTRILEAAIRLLRERGYHGLGLEQVAKAAGVSRQAVYLHFGSKAKLLLASARHIDASGRLGELLAWVFGAPDGLTMLDRGVEAQIDYDLEILPIALAFDAARRTEPDANAVWQDRMRARRGNARRIIARLRSDGVLRPGLTVAEATELWQAMAMPSVLDVMVHERRWSRGRYTRHFKLLIRRALTTALDDE